MESSSKTKSFPCHHNTRSEKNPVKRGFQRHSDLSQKSSIINSLISHFWWLVKEQKPLLPYFQPRKKPSKRCQNSKLRPPKPQIHRHYPAVSRKCPQITRKGLTSSRKLPLPRSQLILPMIPIARASRRRSSKDGSPKSALRKPICSLLLWDFY